jgi:hypothetical protein
MGIREPSIERSQGHLKWLRSFACVAFESGECEGRMHSHHIRSAATAGTGIKSSDLDAVPICEKHHQIAHNIGAKSFELKYNLDMIGIARKFASVSPHAKKLRDAS